MGHPEKNDDWDPGESGYLPPRKEGATGAFTRIDGWEISSELRFDVVVDQAGVTLVVIENDRS